MAITPLSVARNVTTAGTRVTLVASSLPVIAAEVQAKVTNTGSIYLGGSDVSSTNGRVLTAGQTFLISGLDSPSEKSKNVIDLVAFYIDSSVSGEGVIVTYVTG